MEIATEDHLSVVEHLAAEAAVAFAKAAIGDDPIYNAVLGLRRVLQIVEHKDVMLLSESAVTRLFDASLAATNSVCDATGNTVASGRVALGLGATAGLVALFGKTTEHVTSITTLDVVLDRIDYAALLANELDTILRRQSLESRGYPFLRGVQYQRFAALERAADTKVN